MNAKQAEVKLYLDQNVVSFSDYERDAEGTSLTCGALNAQVHRFYHLWSVTFFVERNVWHGIQADHRDALASVLRNCFYLQNGTNPGVARSEIEGSIRKVREGISMIQGQIKIAARSRGHDERLATFEGLTFPNGLPILMRSGGTT